MSLSPSVSHQTIEILALQTWAISSGFCSWIPRTNLGVWFAPLILLPTWPLLSSPMGFPNVVMRVSGEATKQLGSIEKDVKGWGIRFGCGRVRPQRMRPKGMKQKNLITYHSQRDQWCRWTVDQKYGSKRESSQSMRNGAGTWGLSL